jgi:hypothetical protein
MFRAEASRFGFETAVGQEIGRDNVKCPAEGAANGWLKRAGVVSAVLEESRR